LRGAPRTSETEFLADTDAGNLIPLSSVCRAAPATLSGSNDTAFDSH
jgi:hypothetical protein